MPLIYSFVARGNVVLADYTSYTGNFSTVALQVGFADPVPPDRGPPSTASVCQNCRASSLLRIILGSFWAVERSGLGCVAV